MLIGTVDITALGAALATADTIAVSANGGANEAITILAGDNGAQGIAAWVTAFNNGIDASTNYSTTGADGKIQLAASAGCSNNLVFTASGAGVDSSVVLSAQSITDAIVFDLLDIGFAACNRTAEGVHDYIIIEAGGVQERIFFQKGDLGTNRTASDWVNAINNAIDSSGRLSTRSTSKKIRVNASLGAANNLVLAASEMSYTSLGIQRMNMRDALISGPADIGLPTTIAGFFGISMAMNRSGLTISWGSHSGDDWFVEYGQTDLDQIAVPTLHDDRYAVVITFPSSDIAGHFRVHSDVCSSALFEVEAPDQKPPDQPSDGTAILTGNVNLTDLCASITNSPAVLTGTVDITMSGYALDASDTLTISASGGPDEAITVQVGDNGANTVGTWVTAWNNAIDASTNYSTTAADGKTLLSARAGVGHVLVFVTANTATTVLDTGPSATVAVTGVSIADLGVAKLDDIGFGPDNRTASGGYGSLTISAGGAPPEEVFLQSDDEGSCRTTAQWATAINNAIDASTHYSTTYTLGKISLSARAAERDVLEFVAPHLRYNASLRLVDVNIPDPAIETPADMGFGTSTAGVWDVSVDAHCHKADVTWMANAGSAAWMEYTKQLSSQWFTVFAPSSEMLHTATLTGLSSGSRYFFRVHSAASESALSSFTTWCPTGDWPVGGDANLDCVVDVLDMIFVRKRLHQDVAVGDNWQADITTDGTIDVIDLLVIRYLHGSTCSD